MPDRRRIVTGHAEDGTSTVVSDTTVAPRTSPGLPGVEMLYLWGSDETRTYPDDGAEPAWRDHFPPADGARFVSFTLPPAGAPDAAPDEAASSAEVASSAEAASSDEAQAHARESFPGLLETYRDDQPGIHTSDTTDLAIVLSGEVVLGLTDGSEHLLRAGDTIVQNGTAHSWTNRTTEPVEMLFVLVGARREA